MALRAAVDPGATGATVTSVSGTANQVTVTPTTGATVVSLPAGIVTPGAVTVTPTAAAAFSATGVGLGIKLSAATLTDSTTGASTIAATASSYFSAQTYATAANAITITNAYGAYFVDPVASTNVTMTNKWALGADSLQIGTSGTFKVSAAGVLTTGAMNQSGSTTYTAATAGVILKQGANGLCGTFVANGSTPVTVNNTNIAITDSIIISLNTIGGTVGVQPHVSAITASTSFQVTCTPVDTSTYNYAIIKNAA